MIEDNMLWLLGTIVVLFGLAYRRDNVGAVAFYLFTIPMSVIFSLTLWALFDQNGKELFFGSGLLVGGGILFWNLWTERNEIERAKREGANITCDCEEWECRWDYGPKCVYYDDGEDAA